MVSLGPVFSYGATAQRKPNLTSSWMFLLAVNLEPTPVLPGHPRTVSEKISEDGGIVEPIGFSSSMIYFMGETGIVKYDRQSHKFSWVPGTHFSNRWSTNNVDNAAYLNGIFYVFGYNYYFHINDAKPGYGAIKNNVIWRLQPITEKDSNSYTSISYTSIKRTPNGGVSFLKNSGSTHPELLYSCSRFFANCKKLVDEPVSSYDWGRHGHLYYVPYNNSNIVIGPKKEIHLVIKKTGSYFSKLANWPLHFFNNGSFAFGNQVYNKYGIQTGLIPTPPGVSRTWAYHEYWFNGHLIAMLNNRLYVYNNGVCPN